jgi:hypothetical protein
LTVENADQGRDSKDLHTLKGGCLLSQAKHLTKDIKPCDMRKFKGGKAPDSVINSKLSKAVADKPLLNRNQELFVERYMQTEPRNATKAYQEVFKVSENVAAVQASVLLSQPKVRARVTAMESAFIARHFITRDNVLSAFWGIYERCIDAIPVTDMHGRPVVSPVDGVPATHWRFDSKGAIAALQSMGRYLGLFNADTTSGANVQVSVEVAAARDFITGEMMRLQQQPVTIDAEDASAE